MEINKPTMIKDAQPCTFNCFIHWKSGVRKYGPDTSLYRGDGQKQWHPTKKTEGEMLVSMVNLFLKNVALAVTAYVDDTRFPKHHPKRFILKFHKGVLEENNLADYEKIFPEGYQIPTSLKMNK